MRFEESAVPYAPIRRARAWRRRIAIGLVLVAAVLVYVGIRRERAAEPLGSRLVDTVGSTIALRYYDPAFHGVDWKAVIERYRPLVATAPTQEARYALLERMVATLADSHTAVFAPRDLQPPGSDRSRVIARAATRGDAGGMVVDSRQLAPGIGYLRMRAFPDTIAPAFEWAMAQVQDDPRLVLDMRGNPGGLVDSVDATAGVFLPPGTLVSSGLRRFHPFGAQRFRASDDIGMSYQGRLVVIIDGGTQSGAEALARALQYYRRARIVGAPTAGKVLGVDAVVDLEDGGLLRVATLEMFGPDGVRLEGHPVMPDVRASNNRALGVALSLLKTAPSKQH